MWEWLIALPVAAQLVLPIMFMILVTYITIKGKIKIAFGKKIIGIGGKKRDCMACARGIRRLYDAAKRDRRKLISDSDRDKENIIRQHLIMLQQCFDDKFTRLNKKKKYDLDLKVFRGRLKWAIFHIGKIEIQRSFLENGFHLLESSKFDAYAERQYEMVRSLIFNELSLYYDSEIINQMRDSLCKSGEQKSCNIGQLYVRAKDIDNKLERGKEAIDKNYEENLKKFLNIED